MQILVPHNLKKDIDNIIDNINDWFKVNSLSLNFDRTSFLQFMSKNIHEINTKKKVVTINRLRRLKIPGFLC